jgi:hypothetical protein
MKKEIYYDEKRVKLKYIKHCPILLFLDKSLMRTRLGSQYIIWIFMPVGNGILFHRVRGQKLIKTKKKGQKLIGF